MDKHERALEILSKYVNFFDIFPRFYLYFIKKNHNDIYNQICGDKVLDENQVKESVNDYLSMIDSMREKSNYICNWVGCKDELGFFQEMMIECHFGFLMDTDISFFINYDKKINDKEIDKEEFFKLIGLTQEILIYWRNKY